jgi:cytochrome c oxidase assembly protein subunit 11
MTGRTRTPLLLSALAMIMLAGAFASKPLYDAFCRATGYGGTTQRAEAPSGEMLERTVTVRFDANAAPHAPVEFRPLQAHEDLRLGENGMAFFRVANISNQPVTVVATFNVTPFKAGPYFKKVECFCFTEQHLEVGESVEMPVIYYVDPAMADAPRLDDVREITLSYTFFRSLEDAADQADEAASRPPEPAR